MHAQPHWCSEDRTFKNTLPIRMLAKPTRNLCFNFKKKEGNDGVIFSPTPLALLVLYGSNKDLTKTTATGEMLLGCLLVPEIGTPAISLSMEMEP